MDMKQYIGEWVAICNDKVIAHDKNLKKVYKKAKDECPKQRPLVTKVPDKGTMIF
jgi:hypothetical protein